MQIELKRSSSERSLSDYIVFVLWFLMVFCFSCRNETGKFVLLKADKTNIHFNNTIHENDSVNIFDFANIYNGGGVGVGDFNNDGLQDLYFTGNTVANQLYLNKGNMEFTDVTKTSNTDGKGIWSRGVAVVDINNDGLLDMYVCATAKRNARERINILYVNQGMDKNNVPVFKDMAEEYGLADPTQSTMAYFFDYDNDMDLDLYIAVNHIIKDEYTNSFKKRNINGEHPSTGKLYRNDWNKELGHAVFTDVSRSAGILVEGYSHAANIADFNDDGWQDIFVANDYISSNVLYINNGDGTFTDKIHDYFKHTSFNSMGSDVVDVNNDGLDDVIEVDMAPEDNYRKKMFQSPNNYSIYQNSDVYGFQYQYVRNMLHLNLGPAVSAQDSIMHPVFADVGYYSGIAETDWSWTPLVADFDDDGYRDIVFTTGFPKDITDHDFIAYRKESSRLITKKEMMDEIPEVKIHNYIYKNNGGLKFTDKTEDWGFEEPGFSNGAVYADLDNDGDLDIVINNINDPVMLYENRIHESNSESRFINLKFTGPAQNINGIGARAIIYQGNIKQVFSNNPFRGYISSVSQNIHFGTSKAPVDSLEILWPGNLRQIINNPQTNQLLTIDIKNAIPYSPEKNKISSESWFTNITNQSGINYKHKQRDFIDFNIQKLLPHKFSEYGPGIAAGDINGDGLDDFITGGAPGYSAVIFTQNSNGSFSNSSLLNSEQLPGKPEDDRGLMLFDIDNDQDLDLYISSGGYAYKPGSSEYSDQLFINNGKGVFKRDSSGLPENNTSKFCVRGCDFDKDGDIDLFISGRVHPWNYPQPVSSFIYRNDSKNGKIAFSDVTKSVAPSLNNAGLICDAIWSDYDNDGWMDLVIAGEWMSLKFLKNKNGIFEDISVTSGINDKTGWWNSLTSGDFDNDGDIDYVAGNLGENSYYKADDKYPVSLYAKDFDQNGVLECIPTKYMKDKIGGDVKEFTAHTRDDVVEQMPFIKKRFLTYKLFANAELNEIFTKDELNNAINLKANYLSHAFIRNNGNGKFSITPLPYMAQLSVLNGMVSDDFDDDGFLDICINTNDYSTESGNGRYDALNGLVLKGDGKGNFNSMSMIQSGIFIKGNGKGLVRLKGQGNSYCIVSTENRGPVQLHKSKYKSVILPVNADDAYAIIEMQDGKKQKTEFNYGNSFLSQGSRFILISSKMKSCIIVDIKGETRNIELSKR